METITETTPEESAEVAPQRAGVFILRSGEGLEVDIQLVGDCRKTEIETLLKGALEFFYTARGHR